ncbi:MAG TPA: hypothetical protein VD737_06470 [Steroidobacteraceae bacterium]|nr:hypothetical protein [Steroidobacteraceae bacterium]
MPTGSNDVEFSEVRKLLHDVNDELSIAVLQLEMMLESGAVEAQSRESLEESLDACRKAAESLKQVWMILGPRQPT